MCWTHVSAAVREISQLSCYGACSLFVTTGGCSNSFRDESDWPKWAS